MISDDMTQLDRQRKRGKGRETSELDSNWGYDRYGNRTGFVQDIGGIPTAPNPTIDPNTNRFNSGQGFNYDKNGNIVADIAPENLPRTFVFNGDNKQTEVKKDGVTIGRYYYDGEGKRVKKVTDQETTVFVYSAGKLIAEYSTQLSQNPSTNYTTTDHLGSPRIITGQLGQVTARRDFLPFGEELFMGIGARSTNLKYGSSADNVRQKFTGYQKDNETSLDFAEARMYENRYARFTAVDPLLASGKSANPQTFNRYVYVMNRPLFLTDSLGLSPDWIKQSCGENCIQPVWVDRTATPEEAWTEMSYTDYNGNSIVLDPMGPATIEGVGRYEGVSINGVSQGTGMYAAAAMAQDFNLAHGKGIGNFGINLLNSPFTSPILPALAPVADTSFGGLFGIEAPIPRFSYNSNLQKAFGYGTEATATLGSLALAFRSPTPNLAVPDGSFYSVAFETKLPSNLYPGKGYYTHFKAANIALNDAMTSDASIANSMSTLGVSVPRSASGGIAGRSPTNWVWHHDINPGVLQLVPKAQHAKSSIFWKTLHPGGVGGMSIWGN